MGLHEDTLQNNMWIEVTALSTEGLSYSVIIRCYEDDMLIITTYLLLDISVVSQDLEF